MTNGDDPHDDAMRALNRIAKALDVPAETFLTVHPAAASDAELDPSTLDHLPDVVALLRLFVRLKSPEARARCLAYVVQEATNDD